LIDFFFFSHTHSFSFHPRARERTFSSNYEHTQNREERIWICLAFPFFEEEEEIVSSTKNNQKSSASPDDETFADEFGCAAAAALSGTE